MINAMFIYGVSDTGLVFPNNLVVTLTIVSVLSALLGAVIMIVLLNCKR